MTTSVLNSGARNLATVQRYEERFADTTLSLADLVRMEDPAFYVHPWPVYERMQAEAPVYYYGAFNTWILTKHEDVQYAARNPEAFSAAHGILLYDGVRENNALGQLFAGNGDMIGLTDPPRHGELRRIMQPPFTPSWLARLKPRIEGFCDRIRSEIVPGEPVNWTDAVASRLPARVIAAILGIPDDDDEFPARVRAWTDATEELASRDQSAEELVATLAGFGPLNDFLGETFEGKRGCPADDFLSSLLNDPLDNEKLSEANITGFAQLLIAAGADTTRSLLSEMAAHFAMFPGQLGLLREDPSLVPNAIEEVLRFAPAAPRLRAPGRAGRGPSRAADHVWAARVARLRGGQPCPRGLRAAACVRHQAGLQPAQRDLRVRHARLHRRSAGPHGDQDPAGEGRDEILPLRDRGAEAVG